MPGLVPGIHGFVVDGRAKPGHDDAFFQAQGHYFVAALLATTG